MASRPSGTMRNCEEFYLVSLVSVTCVCSRNPSWERKSSRESYVTVNVISGHYFLLWQIDFLASDCDWFTGLILPSHASIMKRDIVARGHTTLHQANWLIVNIPETLLNATNKFRDSQWGGGGISSVSNFHLHGDSTGINQSRRIERFPAARAQQFIAFVIMFTMCNFARSSHNAFFVP